MEACDKRWKTACRKHIKGAQQKRFSRMKTFATAVDNQVAKGKLLQDVLREMDQLFYDCKRSFYGLVSKLQELGIAEKKPSRRKKVGEESPWWGVVVGNVYLIFVFRLYVTCLFLFFFYCIFHCFHHRRRKKGWWKKGCSPQQNRQFEAQQSTHKIGGIVHQQTQPPIIDKALEAFDAIWEWWKVWFFISLFLL